MENKAHALAAGIFVLAMAVLLIALGAWLTRDTGIRHVYEVSTRETVTGLQEQAPVRFRGVEVGKVAAIGFDPKTLGNVLIRLEINRDTPLTRATFATLSYQGVTGLAFVQLDDEGASAVRLEPNDEVPPRIPLRPGLIAKLEQRGEVILEQAEKLTTRLNQFLSDDNQRRFSNTLVNIDRAADSASQLAQRLDATVVKKVDPMLAEAGTALGSVRTSADEVNRAAADFRQITRRLNEQGGPMDRLAEGTQGLAHATDSFNTATLPRINRLTDDASRAVRQLGRAVNNINDNPQSLIFGSGAPRPGPGEPGFAAPGAGQ